MPLSSVTSPFVPKSLQRWPVFASMAIRRASVVAVRILSGQAAAGSGALKYVTPRHVVVKPTFESLSSGSKRHRSVPVSASSAEMMLRARQT
jgi:hypothetical protein